MTSKTVKIAAAMVGAAVLAASAVAADRGNDHRAAGAKSIILGKTKNYPDPACANSRTCQVVARVTGVQMAADGVRRPFQVPEDGQLVSFWLQLPKLTESQVKSFNKLFGGEPEARVAVLRHGVRTRYRLVRQSESFPLKDELGSKGRVTFRLSQPLEVKKGDFIGVSAVTWLPSFAVGLRAAGNFWLASRPKSRCETPSSRNMKRFERYYKRNDAQLQTSTAKPYECTYQTARLIYWARIVPGEPEPPGSDTPAA
ncbi:MAG: hypothetical protein WDZ37_04525 [Solirubrobacterales bacterium]